MPDQTVHCVVERAAKLSEPTRKTSLHEPLAYDNAYAHSMRYRAFNDDGTEADLTGYSVVGAFTPSGHNTIKPLLNGTVSGNVAELILPSACYKHPGRFKFTMNLNKGSVSRSVLWVEGMVERNQTDTIEAPTEVLDVSQVIADAQTAAAEANAARDRANTLALTINATPVSSLNMNSGWVNVTLDKTYAEIFSAASSAKSVVNLKCDGSNIVCRQAEYNSYSINFYGTSLDNTVLIFNVQITASSAQAAMVGSIAMTDHFVGY